MDESLEEIHLTENQSSPNPNHLMKGSFLSCSNSSHKITNSISPYGGPIKVQTNLFDSEEIKN